MSEWVRLLPFVPHLILYQWYQTVSEGTPLSPPCASLVELADWLATHPEADSFSGRLDADAWLRVLQRGYCFSMLLGPNGLESGAQVVARTSAVEEAAP